MGARHKIRKQIEQYRRLKDVKWEAKPNTIDTIGESISTNEKISYGSDEDIQSDSQPDQVRV